MRRCVLAFIAVLACAACGSKPVPHAAPATAQAVPTETVLAGVVRAQHLVAVRPMAAGTIERFLVDLGQPVVEGQPLATLSHTTFDKAAKNSQTSVAASRANLASLKGTLAQTEVEADLASKEEELAGRALNRAQQDYDHQKMLSDNGIIPRLTLDKYAHDLDQAKAQDAAAAERARGAQNRISPLKEKIAQAQAELGALNGLDAQSQLWLSSAEVHAPATGIVVGRRGAVGDAASPQDAQPLFEIADDPTVLEAALQAPAAALARLHVGQAAAVLPSNPLGMSIPGQVRSISGTEVAIAFVSPTRDVRPGDGCMVRLRFD